MSNQEGGAGQPVPPVISDEAVEAAAKMFYSPRNWNTASDTAKANLRFDAEAALEAALPYLERTCDERE